MAPNFGKRVISVMGDGGFWHNGLGNGVANAMFNKQDSVLVILDNNYAAATGQHHVPSTGTNPRGEPTGMTIPEALRGVGVRWIRTVNSYRIAEVTRTLRIRLNGCPSLTLAESPDPLKDDPIAHVDETCVGCGVCGEVAHAAVLCPSFYEVRVVQNPSRWRRLLARFRLAVITRLATA